MVNNENIFLKISYMQFDEDISFRKFHPKFYQTELLSGTSLLEHIVFILTTYKYMIIFRYTSEITF